VTDCSVRRPRAASKCAERRVGLDHRLVDLGVAEATLAHQRRAGEAGVDVAEHLLDPAFEVAGLVVVQQRRAARARGVRVEIRGQRLEVERDRVERRARGRSVDGGDRRHRLAAVAHAAARQRELVLRDRDHAVRDRAIVARHDRMHARHRACAGHIDSAIRACATGLRRIAPTSASRGARSAV
jgi:hypothetical protein